MTFGSNLSADRTSSGWLLGIEPGSASFRLLVQKEIYYPRLIAALTDSFLIGSRTAPDEFKATAKLASLS